MRQLSSTATLMLTSGVALSVLASPSIAFGQAEQSVKSAAQGPAASESESVDEDSEEIIVTGTVLRGAAPTGSNLIGVSREEVTATGASTTSQLLATIPQISNMFNTLPQIAPGTGTQLQVIRPNLRNTPSGNTATGAATLILVDGHRMVGVGVSQSAPDPEAVPVGAIERIEIVPDGGSATYGADAVGGVINYITRRRFDGVQVDARYGFAEDYYSVDGSLTAGKDWGSGSIYASVSYARHDAIFGRDRDYVKSIDWATGIPSSRQCDLPTIITPGLFLPQFNFTLPGNTYAFPGFVAGTFNACDPSDDQAIYPSEKRYSIFAGFSQDLTESIRLDVRAFYTNRKSEAVGGPARGSLNIGPGNPFYRNILNPITDAGKTQTVQFSYGPAFGNRSATTFNEFKEWGVTPTLTADLTDNWQLRAMFNYGHSRSSYFSTDINAELAQAYVTSGLNGVFLNPYNIASSNSTLLANIRNWQTAGESTDEIINPRLIVDGRVFSLPGGDVRLAVGAEYLRDKFTLRQGATVRGALDTLTLATYSRNVKSAFGEIHIPIFRGNNEAPVFHSLDVSLAARYDDYSDFGSTFNPKVGVTWELVDGIRLRANWGKSFNAPTPVDQLGGLNTTIGFQTFFYVVPPGQTPPTPGSQAVVALQGASDDLRPQKATTWSVGVDLTPPTVPGLRASMSYYYIDYRGALGKPPVFNAAQLFANFPQFVIMSPTMAQLQAAAAESVNPSAIAPLLQPGGLPVYQLLDFRTYNLGNTKLSGLDFDVIYNRETGFGSIDARVAGNVQISRKTQVSSLAPFTNDLANGVSAGSYMAQLGANFGNFRAQATLYHTGGYRVVRAANLPQDHVSAFNVVNLFFQYDVNGEALMKDLSFMLNVNNVFDQDPPVYKITGGGIGSIPGTANGATLGRFIQFGVSKKF